MKYSKQIFVIAAGLLLAGCATSRIAGLPASAQIVGGGPVIEWRGIEGGTAILVEQKNHRIVITERLSRPSDKFVFNINNPEWKHVQETILPGQEAANLKFVLYFVPDSSTHRSAEK